MNNIIKALNLTDGAVLTLEKMEDRMEFEAIAVMAGLQNAQKGFNEDPCGAYFTCKVCWDSDGECYPRYVNCHPYK